MRSLAFSIVLHIFSFPPSSTSKRKVSTTILTFYIFLDIPVAVQLIPGGLLFLGALLILPESPRWLRSRGQLEKSASTLAHIRKLSEGDTYIQEELAMMDEQLAATAAYRSFGAQFKELGARGMRNRLASAFAMMSAFSSIISFI